jgi:hypothetical protein
VSAPATKAEFEPVHTVTDYWDGPVRGIADFRGKPHCYERQFDEVADEYSSIFRLMPIDAETFALAMEAWAIWERWEKAFHQRTQTMDSFPALPDDRARHAELTAILAGRLSIEPARAIEAQGTFLHGQVTAPAPWRDRTRGVQWVVRK